MNNDLQSELDALGAVEDAAFYADTRHDSVEFSIHLSITLRDCVRKIQPAWDSLHD